MGRRKISREQLSVLTGLTATTIHRVLHGGAVSPNAAARIADVLGFDLAYVALARFRDELQELVAGSRKRGGLGRRGTRPGGVDDDVLTGVWKSAIAELTNHMAWQGSLYIASGKGRRLALTAVRTRGAAHMLGRRTDNRSKVASRVDVATAMAGLLGKKVSPRLVSSLERELRAYEHDLIALAPERLHDWLLAIAHARAEPAIGIEQLEQIGLAMKKLHVGSDTSEPRRLRDDLASKMQVVHPRGGGITLVRTPTIFGAVNVERLICRNRYGAPAMICNARHLGLELAYVARGCVRLTLSREPLNLDDDLSARGAELVESELGRQRRVVADRVIEAGQVVSFASGLYHRAEMLGASVEIVSTNLTRNLWLGRRYRGDLGPDEGP